MIENNLMGMHPIPDGPQERMQQNALAQIFCALLDFCQ